FVGTRCGIMDQFAACNGHAGSALLLDCRSLDMRTVAMPADACLLVCDSKVKHSLADGSYNERRAQCEAGVRVLARSRPGIRALRDVSSDELEAHRAELSGVVYRRCRHVIGESARVLAAVEALARGDLT